jgi:hypothetical protein
MYFAGDYILYFASLAGEDLMMLTGLFVFMPLLVYLRMFMVNVMHSKGL